MAEVMHELAGHGSRWTGARQKLNPTNKCRHDVSHLIYMQTLQFFGDAPALPSTVVSERKQEDSQGVQLSDRALPEPEV
jgi:hypothetical protein